MLLRSTNTTNHVDENHALKHYRYVINKPTRNHSPAIRMPTSRSRKRLHETRHHAFLLIENHERCAGRRACATHIHYRKPNVMNETAHTANAQMM